MKHNNVLPNQHFRKDWQSRVKTWFNQPGRKLKRRQQRTKLAAKLAPRPIQKLTPAVRCQTVKYNTKLRMGRGFTVAELKEAGLRKKEALTIGVRVDHRRKNRSLEGMQLNVARLKEYQARLIVFPRKAGKKEKAKKGDSVDAAAMKSATQFTGTLLPIIQDKNAVTQAKITNNKAHAYAALRKARSDEKLWGAREARRKAKEEEKEASKK